ncbi:MAG: hypothetical protein H8E54_00325, partial [Candidatus Aminicenantes bacterium]|nr:hypothetical protein [Candidatus Aminicenantes bacterium]
MRYHFKRTFKLYRTVSIVLFLSLLILPMEAAQKKQSEAKYHDYAALTQAMKNLAKSNPKITKLQSIGKTLQNRDIWVIRISGKGTPLKKQA